MNITRILLLAAATATIATGCKTTKKTAGKHGANKRDIACADIELAPNRPHLDWVKEAHNTLDSVKLVRLPQTYEVYSLDSVQIHNLFVANPGHEGDTVTTVVPLPDGCKVYDLYKSTDKRKLRPGMHVLNGTDDASHMDKAIFGYNGTQLRGEVIANGMMYMIMPVDWNNHTYYTLSVRKLPPSPAAHQTMSPNGARAGKVPTSDR